VRLLHVESGQLDTALVKDPHESGTIWGQPYSRLGSANGRYLFTLYIGSNGGAMVHALDLETANARCIDLPGTGDYLASTLYSIVLSKDGRTLWAVGTGYGHVVGIDIAARKVKAAFRIGRTTSPQPRGTRAALSPDGKRIALTDGDTVSVLDLARRKIVKRNPMFAVAIGYAPDGSLRTFT
jgi:DNA-binding beta-propeller fold protein YncE